MNAGGTAGGPVDEIRTSLAGPAVVRMLLGARMRRLREARGITCADAGYAIRGPHSKISRMELGRTGFKRGDVADLLTLYGVNDRVQRDLLFSLVEQANAPGAVPYHLRTPEQIAGFFEGLELVEPGVVPIQIWRPDVTPTDPKDYVNTFGGHRPQAVKPVSAMAELCGWK